MMVKMLVAGMVAVSAAFFSQARAESEELQTMKSKPAAGNDVVVDFQGVAETVPPDEIDWKTRSLKGDTGNVTIYVDSKNMPTEVYVVGVSDIPTTMKAVRAEQFAHRQAEMNAKRAFAVWMKESLHVSVGTTNKTLVITTGDSSKAGVLKETSEDRMMTQENASQFANATWRGMRCWKVFQEAEKSKRIEIWRWSVKEQELARIVEVLTKDGNPDSIKRKPYTKIDSYEL